MTSADNKSDTYDEEEQPSEVTLVSAHESRLFSFCLQESFGYGQDAVVNVAIDNAQ